MVKLKTSGPRLGARDRGRVSSGPKRADAELLTPEHRVWREAVLKRAGGRCEWIENGVRCAKAAPAHRMIADHVVERADGGDPLGEGQCLCVEHNTLKGARARAKRHQG